MGGAARSSHVHRLILYEPSLRLPYSPGQIEGMEKDLDEGRREEIIRGIIVGTLDATEEEFAALRDGPLWEDCLAAAPTAPREARAEAGWVFRPGAMDRITVPALLRAGTESPLPLLKSTLLAMAELRHARLHVLKGHGHGAFLKDPSMVADVLSEFLTEPGGGSAAELRETGVYPMGWPSPLAGLASGSAPGAGHLRTCLQVTGLSQGGNHEIIPLEGAGRRADVRFGHGGPGSNDGQPVG